MVGGVLRRFGLAVAVVLAGTLAPAAGPAGTAVWHRPIVAIGANQSNNWSGYNQGSLEQGGKMFHSVAGTWVVPTATQHASGEAEYSSTWVGIGGGCVDAGCQVTDGTLIQAGTEQDVSTSGQATYSAWWELIPAPSIPITSLTIHAGDRMRVAITEQPAGSEMWTIVVNDLTTGQSFSVSTPYTSTHLTAEWIEETPVVLGNDGSVTVGPLPMLSRVRMDAGRVNGANPRLVRAERVQLVDANQAPLATPSGPDPDHDGFNDCTYAASCPAPTAG